MQGKYIVLEGGEHVGKTTQAALLAKDLSAVQVREPGGTKIGEAIRDLLLSHDYAKEPETGALLHAAQRGELARRVTQPMLSSGRHVVSDRSWISSAAYQGVEGISFDDIYTINSFALGKLIMPDLCIVLDADPAEMAERVPSIDKDYYELMGFDFHNALREKFLEVGQKIGAIVVDAAQPKELVTSEIRAHIADRLAI